jgi:citrate lyase subunit beta/citryl-CoA lyase
LIQQDIEAVAQCGVFAIMVPKLSCREDLLEVNQLLLKSERQNNIPLGSIKIIPLIENALAIENAYRIASTRTDFYRLFTLSFGAADYSHDLGVDMTRDGTERQYVRARLAVACRAAGLEPPLDTPYVLDINDLEALEQDSLVAKNLGFGGKMCVHPNQIETINKVFSYTKDEVEQAQKIIDAFMDAEERGTGAIQLEGKFIDIALVRKAQRIKAASNLDLRRE